jgi:prepilin-type N-terminal cleavage/methylation domain-containing protein
MSTKNCSGFSLLELVVALVVFGVLVGMTIPSTTKFTRSGRVAGAARVLAADVHEARAIANMQRRSFEITFASTKYAIVKSSPRETLRVRNLPYGVSCTATDTATFYPWGITSPISVTMSGQGGMSKVMQVRATGSVQ